MLEIKVRESVSTKLYKAEQEIISLKEDLKKKTDELKNKSDYTTSQQERITKLNEEIEQLHCFLDGVSPLERESKHENSWERIKHPLMTRLAAWLVKRQIVNR